MFLTSGDWLTNLIMSCTHMNLSLSEILKAFLHTDCFSSFIHLRPSSLWVDMAFFFLFSDSDMEFDGTTNRRSSGKNSPDCNCIYILYIIILCI